jgi:hypothetical protein
LIRLRAKLQRTTNNPGKDLAQIIMFCDWLSETNQKQKRSLLVTRSLERRFL